MSRSVICQRCKSLVDINERRWAPHSNATGEQCPISNTIYTAPVIHRSGGGERPSIEFVGAKPVDCPGCGVKDGGLELSFRLSGQNPQSN